MFERALRLRSVEVQEHANAAWQSQRRRYVHLYATEQWHAGPTEAARGAGRVVGGQVWGRREDRALDVAGLKTIGITKRGE